MTALEYTRQLVEFESTSSLSNVPISDFVETTLKRLGFVTERLEYNDANGVRKACLVSRKGSGSGGFAYFGHTDVVPANPWLFADHGPFQPTLVDGRLYGRGTCDMKGSIACMLAAAEQIGSRSLQHPIYITCTADEEIGYGGAAAVATRSEIFREMIAGDAHGIIGEPTKLEVVYAHKGTYGIVATSRGRAAHSSTRAGINANLKMIPFLAEMKRIHDEVETAPEWQHPEFDPPGISWNIGINDHTHAVNITAPQSVCTIYFRPGPGHKPDLLVERARRAAAECGIEFEVPITCGALYVDPQSVFVQEVLSVAGQTRPQTVCYGTDGALFTALKKLLVLGPGDIAQAHTHDEFIALEQLDRGTDLYARLIEHWCC